jgi:four helix bundle protein
MKRDNILIDKALRSRTSIEADINEVQDAHAGVLQLNPAEYQEASTNDFISKLSISLKEARESKYWLELLKGLEEIIKLLVSIIKSTKANNAKN